MTGAERQGWTDIRDRIHGLILDRTYGPGDRLPRDEDLARTFGCARTTVHRAMRALSEAGLVERRRKSGTTVRRDPVTRATLDIPVIRQEVEAAGARYGYHLLHRTTEPAPPAIRAGLGPRGQGPLLHVVALHLADGRPQVCEDRWLCLDTVPEIAGVDLTGISANEWLVRHRPYSRLDLQLYARKATPEDARILDIPAGEALLVIDRTTFAGEDPITSVRMLTAPGYRLRAGG